jgi:hypothetical protein
MVRVAIGRYDAEACAGFGPRGVLPASVRTDTTRHWCRPTTRAPTRHVSARPREVAAAYHVHSSGALVISPIFFCLSRIGHFS